MPKKENINSSIKGKKKIKETKLHKYNENLLPITLDNKTFNKRRLINRISTIMRVIIEIDMNLKTFFAPTRKAFLYPS